MKTIFATFLLVPIITGAEQNNKIKRVSNFFETINKVNENISSNCNEHSIPTGLGCGDTSNDITSNHFNELTITIPSDLMYIETSNINFEDQQIIENEEMELDWFKEQTRTFKALYKIHLVEKLHIPLTSNTFTTDDEIIQNKFSSIMHDVIVSDINKIIESLFQNEEEKNIYAILDIICKYSELNAIEMRSKYEGLCISFRNEIEILCSLNLIQNKTESIIVRLLLNEFLMPFNVKIHSVQLINACNKDNPIEPYVENKKIEQEEKTLYQNNYIVLIDFVNYPQNIRLFFKFFRNNNRLYKLIKDTKNDNNFNLLKNEKSTNKTTVYENQKSTVNPNLVLKDLYCYENINFDYISYENNSNLNKLNIETLHIKDRVYGNQEGGLNHNLRYKDLHCYENMNYDSTSSENFKDSGFFDLELC